MSAKIQWSGLTEFLQEFGSIPKDLHNEGMEIVKEETEGAAVEIAQQYGQHQATGRLARSVRTFYPSASILVGIVRSVAPHAHLFEFGTKQRRNAKGANRGTMPKANPEITVPIARRRRGRMSRRLVELLQRHGFDVGNT
jgi:hypothetical protein